MLSTPAATRISLNKAYFSKKIIHRQFAFIKIYHNLAENHLIKLFVIKTHIYLLAIISTTILAISCTSTIDEDQPVPNTKLSAAKPTFTESRATKIVFHEDSKLWLEYQPDPYALANIQSAYDALQTKASMPSKNSTDSEFSLKRKLKPTHFTVRFYPKNRKQLHAITNLEYGGINVSYHPFDYAPIPDSEAARLGADPANTFPEKNPYKVHETLYYGDGTSEPRVATLPILYVVWPYDGTVLPDSIEHKIDYDVFIPRHDSRISKNGLSKEALNILNRKAIQQASGQTQSSEISNTSNEINYYHGTVVTVDYFLNNYATPLPHLKVRCTHGTDILETYTDASGSFMLMTDMNSDATISLIYQHPKWKITEIGSDSPLSTSMGSISSNWPNGPMSEAQLGFNATDPRNEVLRAADYYFNCKHELEVFTFTDGLKFEVSNQPGIGKSGSFTCYPSNSEDPHITIFKGETSSPSILVSNPKQNHLIGTTLHEIGNFINYGKKGMNYNNFTGSHILFRESYASYVGWYLCESYYASRGYKKTSNSVDISNQANQTWEYTSDSYNTPLFVDLIDDYNQVSISSNRPDEWIKGVPHSVLDEMVRCNNWNNYKSVLRKYSNKYYASNEIEEYISIYNEWFNTH